MGTIRFLALGAGQDVGRSCVVVTVGGRTVMFDCGMHMGYTDERRFPDFTLLKPTGGSLTEVIDLVVITHFHLDHCGALPYLTEMVGYEGPILMTHPTKALCAILLEDFRKIAVERRGEANFFTTSMIKAALGRVKAVRVGESSFWPWQRNGGKITSDNLEIEVCPYYAGHVLGAAMFWVRVGTESVLYTGDYNMTPDRHLGAADLPLNLRPDVVITESTYATTLRESKRARERDFLRHVHQCVAGGGKVLIPVFALGRVQELCVLLDGYWQRMGLSSVPIYYSAGMAETATAYYRVFLDWTNEYLRRQYAVRNLLDFANVRPFERHYADQPGPMVLFSSPGMLHSGTSLEIFKKWCSDERNMLIIPGFCVSGTVGAKVLAGQRQIELDDGTMLAVRLQIRNLSFSAHADAKGIMQMIRTCNPRNVVLVHGEAPKMALLKMHIQQQLGIPCFDPPNGQLIHIDSSWDVPITLDRKLVLDARAELARSAWQFCYGENERGTGMNFENQEGSALHIDPCSPIPPHLTLRASPKLDNLTGHLSWTRHESLNGYPPRLDSPSEPKIIFDAKVDMPHVNLAQIYSLLYPVVLSARLTIELQGDTIRVRSVCIRPLENSTCLAITWNAQDSSLAKYLITNLQKTK